MQAGHAIITGGSSGIGLALAGQLVRRGWSLSLIARDQEKLKQAREQLATCSRSAQAIVALGADVTDQPRIENAIQQAVRFHGPPQLLVTCAGAVTPGYFSKLSTDDFEQMMRVNYLGTVYAIKTALPYMLEEGHGHIVMISSGAGLMGLFGYTAYAPSKFAVRGLAESLRPELKSDGIRVSVVYPPDTQTPQLVEEHKIRPPETGYISATGGVMTAESVAEAILTGIEKGIFCITPGTSMTWLYRLQGLAGPLLEKYFDRLVDRSRKQSGNIPPDPDHTEQ